MRFRKPQRFEETKTRPATTVKFLTNARFFERCFVNWGEFLNPKIMKNSKDEKSSKKSNSDGIQIAGTKTIEEWKDLIDKKKIDWCEAFSFFEKRIETRYLNPIRCIQNMNLNIGEGFAMVNLQCSLIETIESFYNGWIYQYKEPKYLKNGEQAFCSWDNNKVNNERIFVSFFKHREPFKGEIDGSEFFIKVRCGLLHETQTKKGWVIKAKNDDLNCFFKFKKEKNKKIIYRNNFQNALLKVIQQYRSAIVNGQKYGEIPVKDLRENFKAKFNRICEIS